MKDDPIVEEMRAAGLAFTARYQNNMAAICAALREKQAQSGRLLINRTLLKQALSPPDRARGLIHG
jgi:hypothetical protein